MSKKTKKYFGKVTYDVDPYKAVAEGDMTLLKFSLEEDEFDVNSTKWSGWTLLHRAAELGNAQMINFLLEHGANPNQYSSWGWQTPLHMALGRGHLDAAVALVDGGADQFKKNKYQQNASMLGNARGFGNVVKEFKAEVIRREIIKYKATVELTKAEFKKKVREASKGTE